MAPGAILCLASLLAGCQSQPTRENIPPPVFYLDGTAPDAYSAALDWPGTYQGVLPCEGCPGIAIAVQLRADQTATIRERYLDQPNTVPPIKTYQGPFYFDPRQPGVITLGPGPGVSAAAKFHLGSGWIDLRDRSNGAPLAADDRYRLRKTSEQPAQ